MRCSRASHLLQLYIDERLPVQEMRVLEAHLSECATCRQELIFLETIEHALNNIESVKEPPNLTANIMRRVALSGKRATALAKARKEPSFMLFRPSFPELSRVSVGLRVRHTGHSEPAGLYPPYGHRDSVPGNMLDRKVDVAAGLQRRHISGNGPTD